MLRLNWAKHRTKANLDMFTAYRCLIRSDQFYSDVSVFNVQRDIIICPIARQYTSNVNHRVDMRKFIADRSAASCMASCRQLYLGHCELCMFCFSKK